MANILSTEKQVAVISALAEDSAIRQIECITGVHRDTIMRLRVRVGKGCAKVVDGKMRGLTCHHVQFEKSWGFIGKKQRNVTVLPVARVRSAVGAVRVAIFLEFGGARNGEEA
jgi:hypothetical protein